MYTSNAIWIKWLIFYESYFIIHKFELTDVRNNQLRDYIMFGKNSIYSEHLCPLNTRVNVPNIKPVLFRIYVPKLNCSERKVQFKYWSNRFKNFCSSAWSFNLGHFVHGPTRSFCWITLSALQAL